MSEPKLFQSEMPRLSRTLTHPRSPGCCQSCGVAGVIHAEETDPEGTILLTRWQEHDENDRPEKIIVVLCKACSDRLIEPHPRLYADAPPFAPHIGAMRVCEGCRFRRELNCWHPERKGVGGPGVQMEMPQPIRAHLYFGGGRGGWLTTWRGPVVCKSRESVVCLGREETENEVR